MYRPIDRDTYDVDAKADKTNNMLEYFGDFLGVVDRDQFLTGNVY